MINTFSSLAIKMTIATGLVLLGAIGVYGYSQSVSNFTQSFHPASELKPNFIEGNRGVRSSDEATLSNTAEFHPEPNPAPHSTGGTGTR